MTLAVKVALNPNTTNQVPCHLIIQLILYNIYDVCACFVLYVLNTIYDYVVVYFLRTMERGRVKCGQYWPQGEEGEEQFDEFIIINTGMEQNREYTITSLHVHNTQVSQFYLTSQSSSVPGVKPWGELTIFKVQFEPIGFFCCFF